MSVKKGKLAEDRAIKYLQKEKFTIIDRNFYTKFGEIDIIALKNDTIHFVEVKSGENFDPIYNITPQKLSKILKSIEIYLIKKNIQMDYMVDALVIHRQEIELIENITLG